MAIKVHFPSLVLLPNHANAYIVHNALFRACLWVVNVNLNFDVFPVYDCPNSGKLIPSKT